MKECIKKLNKGQQKKLEKKLARKALKDWAEEGRASGVCAYCGARKGDLRANAKGIMKPVILHSHHVIPKEFKLLRTDPKNCIPLCARCHKYALHSPHKNGIYFSNWYKEHYKDNWEYLMNIFQKGYKDIDKYDVI